MKFWIDIANSPHVLFFGPIIDKLKEMGHTVNITVRDFAQVLEMCNKFSYSYTLVGTHGGKKTLNRFLNFAKRVNQLTAFARHMDFDVAVSCGSYFQILAAKILRIPVVTFLDYEFQPAYHIAFRFADRVLVPSVFPKDALTLYGANAKRVIKYNGIKEQIYLSSFEPDVDFLKKNGIGSSKVIVAVRPPPTMALYHNFDNPLFEKVLEYLDGHDNIVMIILPRDDEQKQTIVLKNHEHAVIPEPAVDGRNLVYHSDLVVSAGGTMNREAAVLGTPAYSIFTGKIGAMDKVLMEKGRIVLLSTIDDIGSIRISKKSGVEPFLNENLLSEVTDEIVKGGINVD